MKVLRSRLFELEVDKKKADSKVIEDSKLDIAFGSQIRSYVLQPYRLVKDTRTKVEVGDVVLVRTGEVVGVDGTIMSAEAAVGSEPPRRQSMPSWSTASIPSSGSVSGPPSHRIGTQLPTATSEWAKAGLMVRELCVPWPPESNELRAPK